MSLSKKKLVQAFYNADFVEDAEFIQKSLHPEVELNWYSSTGFRKMNKASLLTYFREMSESYASLRTEIKNLVKEHHQVALNFTFFAETVENPDEEFPLGHFMAIWEIKDGQLYKGTQISQVPQDLQ